MKIRQCFLELQLKMLGMLFFETHCSYNKANKLPIQRRKLLTIQSVRRGRHLVNIHQVAPPKRGSTHQIAAYYSIYQPWKDERRSWPSWSTYRGRFTHISGHQSAAGQA